MRRSVYEPTTMNATFESYQDSDAALLSDSSPAVKSNMTEIRKLQIEEEQKIHTAPGSSTELISGLP